MRTLLLFLLLPACSEYDVIPGTEPEEAPEPTWCEDLAAPDAYSPSDLQECRADPEIGSFTPVVEWTWTDNPIHAGYQQIMAAPVAANLTDDNGDGRVDADDIPDIVFTAFASGAYTSAGALVAISGADGSTLWSVTSAGGHQPWSTSGVAIADLYGSGEPVVLVSADNGLLAVDRNGEFLWNAPVSPYKYGHPAVGDVDGDGAAEIVYGPNLIDAAGNVLWTGTGGHGKYLSFPVDLDGDGLQEVVTGNTVYEHDGTIRWSDTLGDGWPAVGDLDGDGSPEIIRVISQQVIVAQADGTPYWTFSIDDGHGGPPTVADFDGDGYAEVAVAAASYYRVIDGDGTELWRMETQDKSSQQTGSSVFDFEGDGAAEVVYADELTLWIYDGATGTVEMSWDSHSSGTLFEYPLILDVDNDGATEIVVASNDYAFSGSRGITVIGDAADSWAPARPIWNQHAYFITNVEDDGSIPVAPEANWTKWNSFRAGNSETAVGTAMPDLRPGTPSTCLDECHEDRIHTFLPVENAGLGTAKEIGVALYRLDGSTALHDVLTVEVVAGQEVSWIGPIELNRTDFGPGGMLIRVDDDGTGTGAIDECSEEDNVYRFTTFPCDG